ncbi:MAG: hypothetical protein H6742_00135 [Alphaproteobacteria bacterium]|nr:hypothetical protein [Alphaproteobacteria bacterium]
MLPLLLLLACGDKAADDSGHDATGGDTGTGDGDGQTTAVLATVSDDYAVGALATVALDDHRVTDTITDISGDPAVISTGGSVFQLDRYGYDVVRAFAPGEWEEPRFEVALADLANPQDVEVCADRAFVSQYGLAALAVLDPGTGLLVGSVDLSAFADADGLPETTGLVGDGAGRLYVTMDNVDREGDWGSVGGHVVQVDCETMAVTDSWTASGSTGIARHPDGRLMVSVLGEGLRWLDPDGEGLGPVFWDAAAAGFEGTRVVLWEEHALVVALDEDYAYRIGCLDLTDGAFTVAEESPLYLFAMAANDRGEAWLAARRHWETPEGETGAVVWDIATCSAITATPLSTTLAPYSIAFY